MTGCVSVSMANPKRKERQPEGLQFLEHVYGLFGFKYELFLSTRPEDSLGSEELWEEAESQLR